MYGAGQEGIFRIECCEDAAAVGADGMMGTDEIFLCVCDGEWGGNISRQGNGWLVNPFYPSPHTLCSCGRTALPSPVCKFHVKVQVLWELNLNY